MKSNRLQTTPIADMACCEVDCGMQDVLITQGHILLRDLDESDRASFVSYQTDPRYLRLYDFAEGIDRPNKLFNSFLEWQREIPRVNTQLGIFEFTTGRLLGCGGLRRVDDDTAVLGIELSPREWGRFRLAVDASMALVRYGFESMNLKTIIGDTASGNRRVEKLARRFGAEIVARRTGPDWMRARGWQEVYWAITREDWAKSQPFF